MVELRARLALGVEPVRPVDDGAVARAAPVRRDLLGPLVRRAHRVRPADGVVVVGRRRSEVVDLVAQEVGRLDAGHAVQRRHLVEAALEGALRRRAVVADDEIDQRVVEEIELLERGDDAPDVVIGLLEEAGVDLHLAREDRLQLRRHVVPRRDLLGPRRQHGFLRNHAQLLLPREDLLALLVPSCVELPLVLVRPLLRHVVRRMRGARRVVHEERLVGRERLLLPQPVDRSVTEILVQRVTFFGRLRGIDRGGAFEQPRVVLVRLAADEAVEVLEARARRPAVERTDRAVLPHRHLVALAELRGGVAVQLEDLGQRRLVPGAQAAVARRRRRHLGDGAHADRVVVAAAEQRRPRRRAQRRRVEARVLEAAVREPLGRRRVARPAERARGAEADVVNQEDEHVGRARRRAQRRDGRILGVRVLGVVGRDADRLAIGNRQHRALQIVGRARRAVAVRRRRLLAVSLLRLLLHPVAPPTTVRASAAHHNARPRECGASLDGRRRLACRWFPGAT